MGHALQSCMSGIGKQGMQQIESKDIGLLDVFLGLWDQEGSWGPEPVSETQQT